MHSRNKEKNLFNTNSEDTLSMESVILINHGDSNKRDSDIHIFDKDVDLSLIEINKMLLND